MKKVLFTMVACLFAVSAMAVEAPKTVEVKKAETKVVEAKKEVVEAKKDAKKEVKKADKKVKKAKKAEKKAEVNADAVKAAK